MLNQMAQAKIQTNTNGLRTSYKVNNPQVIRSKGREDELD